jgi:hypothetical protein
MSLERFHTSLAEMLSIMRSFVRIRRIIASAAVSYLAIAEYHAEYNGAKLIANSITAEQDSKKGLHFSGVFGKDQPGTEYGFEPEVGSFLHPQLLISLKCSHRSSMYTSVATARVTSLSSTLRRSLFWYRISSSTSRELMIITNL